MAQEPETPYGRIPLWLIAREDVCDDTKLFYADLEYNERTKRVPAGIDGLNDLLIGLNLVDLLIELAEVGAVVYSAEEKRWSLTPGLKQGEAATPAHIAILKSMKGNKKP